jgi:fumarylpyruvate hydrolase
VIQSDPVPDAVPSLHDAHDSNVCREWVVAPAPPASLAVVGTTARFPVRRIFCVGRNFLDHAREMGATIDRDTPVFFCKPADAIVADGGRIPYPSVTHDLHHEVELVVALGRDADGEVAVADAEGLVFGYGVGLDLTRRDLQAQAKARALPWDTAKGFDASAPTSALVPVRDRHPRDELLWLEVNGVRRQQAPVSDMVWDVAGIIHELSRLFALRAGDLVFMGTPAGVAALDRGDHFRAGLVGWVEFDGTIVG